MTKSELQTFVAAGWIEQVCLVRDGDAWELWAHAPDSPSKWEGDVLREARGPVKTWADLGRAYEFVRAIGWSRSIVVEG